jgi:hypothetical protein
MTATSVCTEFLSGLDSDVLEYIVGILEDADSNLDREDGIEMIAGLLVSAEFCDSEDLAAMKAAAIFEKLKPLALGVIVGGTSTITGTSTDKVSNKIGPTSSGTRSHRKKNAGKSKKKGKNKPSAVDDNDNDTAAGADGREIVKIQMAARPVGVEIVKTPMLLYNASRTANTFIHPGEDDKNNYDKIRDLIISDGARGVLNFGGTKAYFYCQITRRKDGQDIVSIDVTSGLAPTQTW